MTSNAPMFSVCILLTFNDLLTIGQFLLVEFSNICVKDTNPVASDSLRHLKNHNSEWQAVRFLPNIYDIIADKQYNYKIENPSMGPLHPFICLIPLNILPISNFFHFSSLIYFHSMYFCILPSQSWRCLITGF